MRSTDCTLTKQTMGRVRRRTSTKQRSMMLVVRSFRHRCLGKRKKASSSGPGLGTDSPNPIGEGWDKAKILADVLLADPAHGYDAAGRERDCMGNAPEASDRRRSSIPDSIVRFLAQCRLLSTNHRSARFLPDLFHLFPA